MVKFESSFSYNDRTSKAGYIWSKFQSILKGQKILDVGADECHLKDYLDQDSQYFGIGKGGNPDLQVDLEKGIIPFKDNEFDVVLCLDVLEHIENIHKMFDELCRVTKKYVIISLPNPLGSLWKRLVRFGEYQPGKLMKYYGLPLEPLDDRHKWFFDAEEAERFINYRSEKNGMRIVQMDVEALNPDGKGKRGKLRKWARHILLRKEFNSKRIFAERIWAVLGK